MADLATTVARWKSSAGMAGQRYAEGVQSTQVDVVGRAIAAQPKMLQGVVESIQSGRWARRLGEVGNAGWKAQTLAKAPNYAQGIQAGEGNYQKAMGVWLPIINQAAAQVQAMPNNSFQDAVARSVAMQTALHNAKLQR